MITPDKYNSLTEEQQYYYAPVYEKFTTKKVRVYSECECCGHKDFMGWEEEHKPIGKPIKYQKIQPSVPYSLYKVMEKRLIDQVTHVNVWAGSTLNKALKENK